MTKNINYVSHKKSKVKSNGKPQLPLADALVEGEIAINYAEDVETLSIKNESGTVVTFSSDNYYTEQKLGSGFTGANSAKTVTEVIVENEKVISSSLNDLNARKMDASAYTPTDLSNYYTKSETSGKTEISTALGLKADVSDIPSVTGYADSVMYNSSTHYVEFYHGTTAGTMVFSYDASPFLIDGMVKSVVITSVTSGQSEVQVLEITWNSAAGSQVTDIPLTDIFNPNLYYTKDEIDEAELVISSSLNDLNDRKLDASAYTPTDLSNYYTKSETSGKTEISNALDGKVDTATFTAHTSDTSIHHTHSNKTYLDGITGTVGTMAYENSSSYSSATQVDTALNGKVNTADVVTAITSSTSASTNPVSVSEVMSVIVSNEQVTSAALTDLNDRKLDASAYTPTDLSNYYTKSETSGKTEISNALAAKLNSATYTAYTAATETALNGKQNTLTAGTGVNITNDVISVDVEQVFDDTVSASTKPVASKALYSAITDNELVWTNAYTSLSGAVSSHTNNTNAHITSADRTKLNSITGTLGTMAYENSSSYSSATQVNSALGGKADTSHNQASSTITAMTSYTSGGTVSPIQTSDTLNQAIGKLESGLGGFRLLQITQQAYDDLQSKDPNTLYIIVD